MKKNKVAIKFEYLFNFALIIFLGLSSVVMVAQDSNDNKKIEKETKSLLSEANTQLQKDNFPKGEADYRKAIAISPKSETAKYNLANAYYNKSQNAEAMDRYKQAAAVATSKNDKHKAFHNLGNTFMNEKKYQDAIDAYKNALRNDPTDDETRYNLALAKELLEKNPPKGGDGENKDKDKNQENKDNNKNEDNKEDEGKDKENDKGDDKEDKDKGDQEDENKEGDKPKDQGQPDKPKEGEPDSKKSQQQQPQPGQLSPQQIKNLLEAMNNEEQKVQEKINAKKRKGARVKSEKDW